MRNWRSFFRSIRKNTDTPKSPAHYARSLREPCSARLKRPTNLARANHEKNLKLRNRDFYALRCDAGFRPPRGRARLLRLFAGDLSGLHPDWTGFRFHGEKLRGPDGEWITPGMLRAYPHLERALHTAMSTKSVLLSL
jgi:hypothetical protein